MTRDHAIGEIHKAVEAAIESDFSVKDFIKAASESWQQVLMERGESAKDSFSKLLSVNGVY